MERKYNSILTAVLCTVVLGFLAAGILLPDQNRSQSERRTLAKFPEITAEEVMSGAWFGNLEDYLADQFPAREWFRQLKAWGNYRIFGKIENNGYYVADGSIGKLDYPLNEKSVKHAAGMFRKTAGLFEGADCYYTIIPDKNYYLATDKGYPVMDYGKMSGILKEQLPEMKALEIFDCFTAEDYYKTDLHIKQEAWPEAADVLLEGMGNSYRSSDTDFDVDTLKGFYGAWYGQAAVRMPADDINYLKSPVIEQAEVYDHESGKVIGVYSEEAFSGQDKYDFFLSGARALLTISNPNAKTDRELILVRDSFGSSLAPVLIEGYRKITLIDLRYIASDLVADYVQVSGPCDVLFALNAGILNSSNMLK